MTCVSQLASVYVLHLPNGPMANHAAPFKARFPRRKITTTKIYGDRCEIDRKYRENMNIRNMNLNEIVRNDQSQRITCHVTRHLTRLRDPRWKILRFSQRKSTRKWISNRVRIRIFFLCLNVHEPWDFGIWKIIVDDKTPLTRDTWHVWASAVVSQSIRVYKGNKTQGFFLFA